MGRTGGAALFLAAALSVMLAGLGSCRPLTTHETYVAQTAREMAARRDWWTPVCFGETRLKKPPLAYWLTLLSYQAFGAATEFSARFPAALAAIVQATLLAHFARRRFGPRAGAAAGFFQITTVATLTQGRLAEADMALSLGVTISLLAFAECVAERSSANVSRRAWAFWLGLAWAVIAKGPVALLFVCGTVVGFASVRRSLRPCAGLAHFRAMAAFITIVAAWPVAMLLKHPDAAAIWRAETIDRFARDPNGVARVPLYYPIAALWLTLPWTGFWLLSILSACRSGPAARSSRTNASRWHTGRKRDVLTALVCWTIAPMALLSLSGGKQEHYLIPALPPLAVLSAIGWRHFQVAVRRRYQRRQPRFSIYRPCWARAFAAATVAAIVGTELFLLPRLHGRGGTAEWLRQATADMSAKDSLAIVGHSVQWLAFYQPASVIRFDTLESFAQAGVDAKHVLTTTALANRMTGYTPRRLPLESSTRGVSSAKLPVLLDRTDATQPVHPPGGLNAITLQCPFAGGRR